MKLVLIAAIVALAFAQAASAENGKFDIGCAYSHSLPDDPIMFPGEPGASHLHDFFGFKQTDAFSTAVQMLADLRTDPHLTTCTEKGDFERFPAANASGYWTPAVYWNGQRVRPNHVHIYYRRQGQRDVEPFPTGFKFVAGDPMGSKEQQRGKVRWFCGPVGGSELEMIPADCDGHRGIHAEALTASCWNGELDSFDHRSHVAYPEGDGCPAGYPRRLPRLTMHFAYPILEETGKRINPNRDRLTLSSGAMWRFHADYLSAWEPARLALLVEFCLNQRHDCKRKPPPPPAPEGGAGTGLFGTIATGGFFGTSFDQRAGR